MVKYPTSAGWQFFGTILCGIVFALPIIMGYFIVKWIIGGIERRKEKIEKDQTVI